MYIYSRREIVLGIGISVTASESLITGYNFLSSVRLVVSTYAVNSEPPRDRDPPRTHHIPGTL